MFIRSLTTPFPSGTVTFVPFERSLAFSIFHRRRLSRQTRVHQESASSDVKQPRSPCLPAKKAPRGTAPPESAHNDGVWDPSCCQFSHRLRRKARTCVRFLCNELGLKRAHALPSRITCGFLRTAIRSCFGHLTEVQELSVKTSQKLETHYCKTCLSKVDVSEKQWKKKRIVPAEVDEDHLRLFASQVRRNIEHGWNRGKYPYIPNGHACLGFTRCDGGTWNAADTVEPDVSVISVVTAGKPRIVTLFSERNTSVLHSLHKSLYDSLRRYGWLLIGDPTNDRVASLEGGAYISVDYQSATDNIKIAYVRATIDALIEKGVDLTDEECSALRCLYEWKFCDTPVQTGQPMGSKMSFPMLCLFNKTLVDLSLNDLLIEGRISFKEWTSHRCLINGDDLLTRDCSATGELLSRLMYHAGKAGPSVNNEKTMVDSEKGEINSTLFVNAIESKKVNCGALFMKAKVGDVIGFADRSTNTTEGFLFCVRRHRQQLRQQEVKIQGGLCLTRFRALCRDLELRSALTSIPIRRDDSSNLFPVSVRPRDYGLSREEEIALIDARVRRIRASGYVPSGTFSTIDGYDLVSLRKSFKRKLPTEEDTLLSVLVRGWEKKRAALVAAAINTEDTSFTYEERLDHVCDDCAHRAPVFRISCEIKSWKLTRGMVPPGDLVPGFLSETL